MTTTVRLTEAQWQDRVTGYASLRSWLWVHFRPARTAKGWRTPVSGPMGAGFPDLLLCRGERLVALELKSAKGRVTDEQSAVLAALAVAGVESYVARPADWDTVQGVLR